MVHVLCNFHNHETILLKEKMVQSHGPDSAFPGPNWFFFYAQFGLDKPGLDHGHTYQETNFGPWSIGPEKHGLDHGHTYQGSQIWTMVI
jgi:hypothetical protein